MAAISPAGGGGAPRSRGCPRPEHAASTRIQIRLIRHKDVTAARLLTLELDGVLLFFLVEPRGIEPLSLWRLEHLRDVEGSVRLSVRTYPRGQIDERRLRQS